MPLLEIYKMVLHKEVIIYLVNEIGECSQISWESNKLKSVVKSAVALEILAQAEC